MDFDPCQQERAASTEADNERKAAEEALTHFEHSELVTEVQDGEELPGLNDDELLAVRRFNKAKKAQAEARKALGDCEEAHIV